MNLFYFLLIESMVFTIGVPVCKTLILKYKQYKFINKLNEIEILKQNLLNKNKKIVLTVGLKFSVNLYNIVQKTFVIILFIKLYNDIISTKQKITFLNFIK